MTTYRQFPQFPCSDFVRESQELAHRILGVANTIFDIALEKAMLEIPNRRACALALWSEDKPTPLIISKVGNAFPDNQFRRKSFVLVSEKLERAMKNGDLSSYVTRDGKTKWGGGIIIKPKYVICRWGITISGLREHEDEAIAVITAMYTFGVPFSSDIIGDILKISNNFDYTQKLLNRVIDVIGEPC